jgi:hypothetical protein
VLPVFSRGIDSAVDDALVGRYSKPEEGDPGLRVTKRFILCKLSSVKIFFQVIMKKLRMLLFACLLLASACAPKQEERKIAATAVNQLIDLTITTPAQEQISLRELDGKNIFVFFSADCDHCQREAAEIHDHLEAFSNYSLYFISADSSDDQQRFAKDYKLAGQKNIFFGRTEPIFIYQTVGSIPTPSVYIYNEERRLVKKFNGETPIAEIIRAL